jgi:hypothetical protein
MAIDLEFDLKSVAIIFSPAVARAHISSAHAKSKNHFPALPSNKLLGRITMIVTPRSASPHVHFCHHRVADKVVGTIGRTADL